MIPVKAGYGQVTHLNFYFSLKYLQNGLRKNYPRTRRFAINSDDYDGLLLIAPTALGAIHAKA